MEGIRTILKRKYDISINDNNVNKEIDNFVNIDNPSKEKYALDKSTFTPNNEKSQLAETISKTLGDLNNFACYLDVVNRIGTTQARSLLKSVQSDVEEKKDTQTPVRKPGAYFMWKFKNKKY